MQQLFCIWLTVCADTQHALKQTVHGQMFKKKERWGDRKTKEEVPISLFLCVDLKSHDLKDLRPPPAYTYTDHTHPTSSYLQILAYFEK